MPVANDPLWLGIDLYAQGIVADPLGAFLGLAAVSNGQALLLGN